MRMDKASKKLGDMDTLDQINIAKVNKSSTKEDVQPSNEETGLIAYNHFKNLKDNRKIMFTSDDNKDKGCINKLIENTSNNINSLDSRPLMNNNNFYDKPSLSDSNSQSLDSPVIEGRPHVFVFIDESVALTKKTRLEKRISQIRLGDRKYNARKVYHDNEETVITLLISIFGFNLDLTLFMKRFKISQISGFIVHPLTKMGDLVKRENHLILNRRKNGNFGFEKSLQMKTRMFGLENLGNTCFMNSALQCILACKEFTDYLLLPNQTLFNIDRMPLTKAIHQLVACGDNQNRIVAPLSIKQKLGERKSMYLEAKEQDAVEFINDFFDVIHEEIILNSNERYRDFYTSQEVLILSTSTDEGCGGNGTSNIKEDDGLPKNTITNKSEIEYQDWLDKNRSIVTDLFFSKMKSSIVCSNCKASRSIFEPSLIHSIPVPVDGFYFEDIILFYDSPQKVPLKIFSKGESTVGELREELYSDYDFQFDILFVIGNKNMDIVCEDIILSSIKNTLYCYEYKKEYISDYYWASIVTQSIWGSYYFDFNFLIRLNELNDKNIYDVFKSKLTPFLDHTTAFMLYENIEQFFMLSCEQNNIYSDKLIDRPFIRLTISNYNYKRLFGTNFTPIKSIIQLLAKPTTLSDCINLFLEKEFIFGRDKKFCENCFKFVIFYKKLDFEEFPKYLIIQLKRFKFNGRVLEKLETFIDFPLDTISIQGIRYNIIGISNHISPTSFKSIGFNNIGFSNIGSDGHYTAYVKKETWYYCNDQKIEKINGLMNKKNAYIFFLEKCT